MVSLQNVKQSVANKCHTCIEAGNKIATKTEGAEKASKFVISAVESLQVFKDYVPVALLAPCMILRTRLKTFVDIVGALAFTNRGKEWFTPDDSLDGTPDAGKRFWQSSKNTKVKVWHTNITLVPKIWNRAFLSVAAAIDAAKFLDAVEMIHLGKIASFAVGRVPVLGLVKDTCVMGASVFSFWENCHKLNNSSLNYSKTKAKHRVWKAAAAELQKPAQAAASSPEEKKRREVAVNLWKKSTVQRYENEIQTLKKQSKLNEAQKLSHKWEQYKPLIEQGKFEDFCKAKQAKLKAKLEAAKEKKNKEVLKAEVELKQLKMSGDATPPQLEAKKAAVEKLKAELAAIDKDLKKLNTLSLKQLAQWKEEKLSVREENISTSRNKSWITVANEVTKVGVIGTALTVTAVGATAITLGSVVVSTGIVITFLALVMNSIGLTKFLYDEFHKQDKPEKKLKDL